MAELVDALDLGSSVFGREGSSPFIRIALGYIGVKTLNFIPMAAKAKSYSKLAQK